MSYCWLGHTLIVLQMDDRAKGPKPILPNPPTFSLEIPSLASVYSTSASNDSIKMLAAARPALRSLRAVRQVRSMHVDNVVGNVRSVPLQQAGLSGRFSSRRTFTSPAPPPFRSLTPSPRYRTLLSVS